MRKIISELVSQIKPLDELEARDRASTLAWIESGAELCRIVKPATPPKHLVSYFALFDRQKILLVDHLNAQLWLPTGGHVEAGEHPSETVKREAKEELAIEAQFIFENPIFISVAETVGLTAGHTDVSLWYALRGNYIHALDFDRNEFASVRWFDFDDVPMGRTDPHMERFLKKYTTLRQD